MSSQSWDIWQREVLGRNLGNSTKRIGVSLVGKIPKPVRIPNRAEVIQYFAKKKAYPPGWRIILRLPDNFMPEMGGCGLNYNPNLCAPWIDQWKLKKDKDEA